MEDPGREEGFWGISGWMMGVGNRSCISLDSGLSRAWREQHLGSQDTGGAEGSPGGSGRPMWAVIIQTK